MPAEYNATHQPATPEEQGLVREMVASCWRIQRLWTAETALLDLEMIKQRPELEKLFATIDPGILLGVSLQSLADKSRCLALLSRYESRLTRNHEKTRRTLRELQKERGKTFGPACASPEPPPAISSPDSVQSSEPIQPPPAAQ